MKKRFSLILLVILLFSVLPSNSLASDSLPSIERYIVFFNNKINDEIILQAGGEIIYKYDLIQAASIEISPKQLEILKDSPLIKEVSKDHEVVTSVQRTPWGHENINLIQKSPANLSGRGVKIAILDSGVDENHPDLNIKGGICVLDLLYDPDACQNSYNDDNGHGTHVAGVIAAKDNNIGIVGIAPNAEIYSIKALNSKGEGTTSTVMAGLEWAIENNIDIINMSISTEFEDRGMKKLIDKAYAQGILIVAAAGNSGNIAGNTESVEYPGKFPNVIAVSAVNKNNVRISSSSTGKEVELAAPGYDILSTYPTNLESSGYAYMTGTSMAAPFVTGMAALYKEKYPTYSNVEIRKLLQENALDLGVVGKDNKYGYGLVQIDQTSSLGDDGPIKFQTNTSGLVELNFETFLEDYDTYNLYRHDQLIIENGMATSVTDYGTKGRVKYTAYPLVNGVEQKDQLSSVVVNITSPEFVDLSNLKWYSRYLIYLNTKNILQGYEGKLIKPDQYVTRAEAVAMLGRAKGYDGVKRTTKFKDVPSQSFASGYIQFAAEKGVLSGFSDGTFKPNEPVTRAEMAILLAKAFELPKAENQSFNDVTSSMSGYQEISNLAEARITQGYGDGTFRPYDKMYRSTYAVFLAKADNLNFR